MRPVAPRGPLRGWHGLARGALLSLALGATAYSAAAQSDAAWQSERLRGASYEAPTSRYAHGVLGDAIEYGALVLSYSADVTVRIALPAHRVFEDVAPRLVDIDGDGRAEVLTIESDRHEGARLAIYDGAGLRAATPFIGTRFRWRAPVAIADLDGDGQIEIAEIDRPHLAKILRIWRYRDGALVPVVERAGFSNHRIGEDFISGGLRDCGQGAEMILADGSWRQIMSVRFDGVALEARALTAFAGPESFAQALRCS